LIGSLSIIAAFVR